MSTDLPPIQLSFLGLPQFSRDGQRVNLAAAKSVALLAYLAATYMPQPRERLLDLFWPDSAPEAARKNLRNTLWAIRRVLGDEILDADDDRLSLHPSVEVDLVAFTEMTAYLPAKISNKAHSQISNLKSQILLYRGPFLDGLNLTDAPDFEIWLTAERERLGQLYLRTLASLIEAERARANWPQVIWAAHLALTADNLHEPMYRALMEAHARMGERAESLRQYEALRVILAAELGVEPLPETEMLRTAILSGDLNPATPPTPKSDLPQSPNPTSPQVSTPANLTPQPFVGRQTELSVLTEALQQAATGQPRLVLLTGEMGLGKSRLWQEWSAHLPANLTILTARCLEATQNLPLVPLTELFRHPACLPHLLSPAAPLAPLWLAEIARLLPELRLARPDLPTPASLPPEEERRRVFEAFGQGLFALPGRPLILFMDDVHWADQTTLAWLGYLAHRWRDQSLLLILAYRPEDTPASLVHLLAGWNRDGWGRRLPLTHLAPSESATLVTALGIAPSQADRLYSQSAGNPYFLLELCRAAPGDVPPALAELICARLDRLPDSTRQVLQSAAILEPDFDLTTLRRTSGRSDEEVIEALDDLLSATVLVEQGSHYAFAHPLVAAVVRHKLSGARRAFIHRRAAESLESVHTYHLSPVAGRLASHYAQAGESHRAAHFATLAAEYALTLAAPAEAVDFYRQALAWESTPARQLGLGQALQWQGDLTGARSAFQAALDSFVARQDQTGAAQSCLQLGQTYLPAGRADETVYWAKQSLAYLDHPLESVTGHIHSTPPDPATHAQAHLLLGSGLLRTGQQLSESERHLTLAARLAADNRLTGVAAQSRFELATLLAHRGDLTGAVQLYEETIWLSQAVNYQYLEVLGHNNAAYHALLAGHLDIARAHLESGLALAESLALIIPLQYLYSTRGELALAEQQWLEAETWFQRGLVEAEKYHNLEQAANYRANLSLAARGRGNLDSALLWLEQARTEAASLSAPYLQTQLDLWLAELQLERGERACAEAALSQAETRLIGGEWQRLQSWAKNLWAQLS